MAETEKINVATLILLVLEAGAVEIRKVPLRVTNEEVENLLRKVQPFLYASGNWGPGYVSIKGLVAQGGIMNSLVEKQAHQIKERELPIDFVAGNITGGVIPGWLLSQELSVPFVYVGGTRKKKEAEIPITMVNKDRLEDMSAKLCETVIQSGVSFNFIAGLVPSSMILGYRLSRLLSKHFERIVPFVYIRDVQKKGGQKEIITGIRNNPFITIGDSGIVVGQVTDFTGTIDKGMEVLHEAGFKAINSAELLTSFDSDAVDQIKEVESIFTEDIFLIPHSSKGMVVEELANFAQTTTNSVILLRDLGYEIDYATSILFYNNPEAVKTLAKHKIKMIHVFTLPELIAKAEEHEIFSQAAIDDYRRFLQNPFGWQAKRGLKPIERGGTK